MGENKKLLGGQEGAAWLIGIITLLLIFYVVFLPPEERQKLLYDQSDLVQPDGKVSLDDDNILIKESLGYLSTVPSDEKELSLPNFILQEVSSDVVFRDVNPFILKKGWFTKKIKELTFNLPKLEDTENMRVTLQAPYSKGILRVELNDQEVYDARLTQQAVVINLPKELLNEANKLKFSAEGGFFERQEHQIEDMTIAGSIAEKEKLTTLHPFTLTQAELETVESARLRLYLSCEQLKIGKFAIRLNGAQVYSSIPLCGDFISIQLDTRDLRQGRNTLVFEGEKGAYDISESKLKLNLKKTKSYIQYFEITDALYSDIILDKFKDLVLEIDFIDDSEQKRARINVNGRYRSIDQKMPKFKWILSEEPETEDVILPGRNYIEITPLDPLTIRELRVKVE